MNTRNYDWKELEKGANSPDPSVRRQVKIAAERIKHETQKVKDMRQALVQAHRHGDKQEIADIHEFVKNKPEYLKYGGKNVWQ